MPTPRLKKHIPLLQHLSKLSDRKKKIFIKSADKSLIDSIRECCVNILNGCIPLTSRQKTRLKRNKRDLRQQHVKKIDIKLLWKNLGAWATYNRHCAQQQRCNRPSDAAACMGTNNWPLVKVWSYKQYNQTLTVFITQRYDSAVCAVTVSLSTRRSVSAVLTF